jgi:uncharacterized membrane protein
MKFSIDIWQIFVHLAAWLAFGPAALSQTAETINFENDIKPIFENNCIECHGPNKEEGSFRIDDREIVMDYVAAGDAENSDLMEALTSEEDDVMMPPPDSGGPLDDSDIRLVKTWINEGANWPDGIVMRDVKDAADYENVDNGNQDASKSDSSANPETPPDSETSDDTKSETGEPTQEKKADANKPSIWKAIGSLHPATVHVPVGLLLAGGLFALLSLRGNFVMSDCAYYCLWLGTLGAIIASATGWWFAPMQNSGDAVTAIGDLWNQQHKVYWHRNSALIVTLIALLLALFAANSRSRDPDNGVLWKLGMVALAIGIGFVGYKGGELTWKTNHYRDLKGIINQYIPVFPQQTEVESDDESSQPPAKDDQKPSSENATGEASAEGDSGKSKSTTEIQ